jgi:hypothetical protein
VHFTVGSVIFLTTLLHAMFALLHGGYVKESVKNIDEEDSENKDVKSKEEITDKQSKETRAVGEKSLLRLGWEINASIDELPLLTNLNNDERFGKSRC